MSTKFAPIFIIYFTHFPPKYLEKNHESHKEWDLNAYCLPQKEHSLTKLHNYGMLRVSACNNKSQNSSYIQTAHLLQKCLANELLFYE